MKKFLESIKFLNPIVAIIDAVFVVVVVVLFVVE